MKLVPFLFAALCACASAAQAGTVQVDLASLYNIDGVANPGDLTQSSLDQANVGGNFVFATQALATSRAGASGNGLLDSGFYGANAFHPDFQLGYGLNPEGNNVLQFAGTGPVTVALSAGAYREIHVAAMTGGGASFLTLLLHYSDGDVLSRTAFVSDWYDDFAETADNYYIENGLDRINADQSGYENVNDPGVFGYRFLTDETRQLLGFDLVAAGTSQFEPRMNILGAAAVAVPEPGSIALLMLGLMGVFWFKRKSA